MKFKIAGIILLVLIFSCTKNEEDLEPREASFNSFKIKENTISGLTSEAQLDYHLTNYDKIDDHGVIWFKKIGKKHQLELGPLTKNKFESFITKKLIKDSIYSVYPYIKTNNKIIYGDTLKFKSLMTTPIIIDSLYPKKGFVYDTISIVGKNFCVDTGLKNRVWINKHYGLNTILATDSIIKFIIPEHLTKSELKFSLESCGIKTDIEDVFNVDSPKLDSVSTRESYVGETMSLYGKNINSTISEVWIEDKKTDLKYLKSTKEILAIVPKGLSSGKVSVKLKVLDNVIYKPNFFQTTTPYIEKLSTNKFGFLDTISIIGKYFKQKNKIPKIFIGDREQSILSYTDTIVKVVINSYFTTPNPILELKVSDFVVKHTIEMLPPKILGFNKDVYSLEEDNFIVNTDNFLGDDIKIGDRKKPFRVRSEVDNKGNLKLSLLKWLDIRFYHHNYKIISPGELEVQINTQFGSDTKNVKILPPEITAINKTNFSFFDQVVLTGNNFAYSSFTSIYIDNKKVPRLNNSSYSISNNKIYFDLVNIASGTHRLYVETAGQKSNEIEFNVKKVSIHTNSISATSGTRRDRYKITGENLDRVGILANDKSCNIVKSSNSEIEFIFPYDYKLPANIKLTAKVGSDKIDISNFTGVESHNLIQDSFNGLNYYGRHISFSDENNWFFVNNNGTYKFSTSKRKWEIYDAVSPPFNTPIFGEKAYISTVGDLAYYPLYNKLFIYNIKLKKWSVKNINLAIKNGVVKDGYIYGIVNNEKNYLYKYNIEKGTFVKFNKPSSLHFNFENITFGDDKIFINPYQGSLYSFNIKTEVWKNLGRPKNLTSSYYNIGLYYTGNTLYFSGGTTAAGTSHRFYGYDFNLNKWIEKTPLLKKMYNHAVFKKGDYLYFGLGLDKYGYSNLEIDEYSINDDPH